ncbi:MAG: hypothetical protein CVU11_04045, partial [Bacteroidetes bacterium HGW-Bacteroidetes-6]
VGESVYMSFAYSSALAFGFGLVLYIAGDRNKSEINKRDGFLTIFITWGSVALVGSLPFFLSGSANSYGDALFESIAGFSTNGLSLLDFNHTPASIVLWRGIIEWVGGIGIIIFIISFIPFFRSGQARVFFFDRNDETLGKITSSISGTARRLMLIYTGFTIVLLIILLALGLNLHDALLYTFSTMSTSGFSPLNGEVSHLSDAVLITISVFMFVAGSNLYLSYHLLKLRMKKIISNDEFRWYVLSIFIPLIFLMGQYFATEGFSGWHDTFPTTFNIVSIITTTGFYIGQNIPVYNHFWWIMLFLLMFLGSAAASSGGGINVFRQVVLFRSMRKYFLSIFHPNIVYKVRFNQIEIGNNTISRVMGFLLIYILVFVVGLLLLTLSGFGFEDSMAMSVAFLSNTGNAVRLLIVDFNMHNIEWYDKLIFAIMMLFGRLQIIPILIIVSPAFWKK